MRWWAPWATTIPHRPKLRVPELDVRSKPAFEYREPFWFVRLRAACGRPTTVPTARAGPFPRRWGAASNTKVSAIPFIRWCRRTSISRPIPSGTASSTASARTSKAQLCLSNPELRDFVVQRVKEWLREAPDAKIISVTQNDCAGACKCPQCKAIDDAEGSLAGSMVAFVNYVAEKIEPEFPDVAVDTFAYQYTRHPPKTIEPRPNVIVRLCSIECNFREPLDHPSNAAFLADLATLVEDLPPALRVGLRHRLQQLCAAASELLRAGAERAPVPGLRREGGF